MNAVHAFLIAHIRKAVNDPLPPDISAKSDIEIARMMFSNYRGTGATAKGLRLTPLGLSWMRKHFQAYDISVPDGTGHPPSHIVYLDRHCKLPYFINDDKSLVLFDSMFGVRLKLSNGDLSLLIRHDGLSI